jgi:hypothetical protein
LLTVATESATDPTTWVTGCTTEPAAWVTEFSGAPPEEGLDAVELSANNSAAATLVAGSPAEPTSAATVVASTIRRQRPGRQRQFMRGLQLVPRNARSKLSRPFAKRRRRHSNKAQTLSVNRFSGRIEVCGQSVRVNAQHGSRVALLSIVQTAAQTLRDDQYAPIVQDGRETAVHSGVQCGIQRDDGSADPSSPTGR